MTAFSQKHKNELLVYKTDDSFFIGLVSRIST
jgi:hypothetical protein